MPIFTKALMSQATSDRESAEGNVHTAAGHLYDAECAFHDANQTHVDAWILAASDRLHGAVATYLAAVAASVATTDLPPRNERTAA